MLMSSVTFLIFPNILAKMQIMPKFDSNIQNSNSKKIILPKIKPNLARMGFG